MIKDKINVEFSNNYFKLIKNKKEKQWKKALKVLNENN